MKVSTLISTMDIASKQEMEKLLKKMNASDAVVINQIAGKCKKQINGENYVLYNINERGLSKSRNRALERADCDICLLSDDDMKYDDNYVEIIKKEYEKNRSADILIFYVENAKPKNALRHGRVRFLKAHKACSVQITFKRSSIIKKSIKFDERFGAGSRKFILGEESIFLCDCLRKRLKIYYSPAKIGKLSNNRRSSWFKGFNKTFFNSKGACYYRMSKWFSYIDIFMFAIRKNRLYKKDESMVKAIEQMLEGRRRFIFEYEK